MSLGAWIVLGLLGGLGAVGRFLLDGAIGSATSSPFPFGTLAVNLLGTLALGLLAGAVVDDDALALLGVGALGSFTTFSTWMFESQRLSEDGEFGLACANLVVSIGLGVALAWIGLQIGGAL